MLNSWLGKLFILQLSIYKHAIYTNWQTDWLIVCTIDLLIDKQKVLIVYKVANIMRTKLIWLNNF